ncbi:signal peptidase I [Metabacillus sp. FJAT-52054]|uniref:Signal peptidase I n=1 Tax=Metabacillus sediminis TaxID=3117746 RepID=A0ABZ2NHD8_9BACI
MKIQFVKRFLWVLIITLSLFFIGNKQTIFPYQIKNVLSGSMEPAFWTGSVILIKTPDPDEKISKGDVITFEVENHALITHRVVEVVRKEDREQYRTKGDNNDGPDLEQVKPQQIKGIYTGLTIPFLGYLFILVNSKFGSLLFMVIPGILLLYLSIKLLRTKPNEPVAGKKIGASSLKKFNIKN